MSRFKRLKNKPDVRARARLVGLYDKPDEISIEKLDEYFKNKDWGVRRNVVSLLSYLDSDDSIRKIASTFCDTDWTVQNSAAYSIARVGIKAKPILDEVAKQPRCPWESVWVKRVLSMIDLGDRLELNLTCRRDIQLLMWTCSLKDDIESGNGKSNCVDHEPTVQLQIPPVVTE
ncbi:MAG: hypothetical protein KJ993_13945 [Actinobacteria bacterium]|nr:hypothetical protein [Actinomycetota bacterium]MBU1950054.1 hypothetical protein [Candidatus Eisenbacteria bacterium]